MNLRLAPQRILLSDDTLQAVLQGAIITYGESGLEQKVIRYFSNGVGREMWKFIQYELSIILNNVFFDNIKAVISFLNENGVICSIQILEQTIAIEILSCPFCGKFGFLCFTFEGLFKSALDSWIPNSTMLEYSISSNSSNKDEHTLHQFTIYITVRPLP